MRIFRIALVVLALTVAVPVLQTRAEAGTSFHASFAVSHPGYRAYYRPYYRNHYRYYPRYNYGWGLGWGWGHRSYAYYPGYYPPARYYYGYAEVRTEVKPQTAQVFVDGGFVGVTDDYDGWWQRLNLDPGTHRLVFRAPGFQPYVVDLRVLPGLDYHVKYQMQPGTDSISDQEMLPERRDDRRDDRRGKPYADDDDYRERSPNRDRNYDPRRPSQRYGSQPPREEARSDRRQLTLSVQPSDATVYIDGTYYGTGESGQVQVLLPDGPHRIEVVRPGFESFEKDIQVGENFTSSMTIMLQKK